jgi:hypothetical protein
MNEEVAEFVAGIHAVVVRCLRFGATENARIPLFQCHKKPLSFWGKITSFFGGILGYIYHWN